MTESGSLSNAHKSPPLPTGLARGTLLLLEKRLSDKGLTFDCKAYIDENGDPCIQVYVDNAVDPNDFLDLHYVVDDDTPDELYAIVREDLEQVYDL